MTIRDATKEDQTTLVASTTAPVVTWAKALNLKIHSASMTHKVDTLAGMISQDVNMTLKVATSGERIHQVASMTRKVDTKDESILKGATMMRREDWWKACESSRQHRFCCGKFNQNRRFHIALNTLAGIMSAT
jgi:hypothetical protein